MPVSSDAGVPEARSGGLPSLGDVLVCPACHGDVDAQLRCGSCGRAFALEHGICRMLPDPSDSAHDAFYTADDPARFGRDPAGMPSQFADPVRAFADDLPREALVVEIGAGRGAFRDVHPGHIAVDYSFSTLRTIGDGTRVQADAQALPFRSGSIDAFFSVATLEHVPHPERALAEIDRCLKPGGGALLYPAWYVRPWASSGLAVRPYASLAMPDRLRKATIPLRDSKPFQFARVLPGRVRRELALRRGDQIGFRYRRLDPKLDEYLAADSDAFTSMDPEAASAYFISRGYRDLNRTRASSRLLYGYEPVRVAKP